MKKICFFALALVVLSLTLGGCGGKKSLADYYDKVYQIDSSIIQTQRQLMGEFQQKIMDSMKDEKFSEKDADELLNSMTEKMLKEYKDGEKKLKKIRPPKKAKEVHQIMLEAYGETIKAMESDSGNSNTDLSAAMEGGFKRAEWYAAMKNIFVKEKIQKEVIVEGQVIDENTAQAITGGQKPAPIQPSSSTSSAPATTAPGSMNSNEQYNMCKKNLKILATKLEMNATTDNDGRYPASLNILVPKYLEKIPACPAAGYDTYSVSYQHQTSPDLFTIYCSGNHHSIVGIQPNKPSYSASGGLDEGRQ